MQVCSIRGLGTSLQVFFKGLAHLLHYRLCPSAAGPRLRDTKLLCKGQQDEADVPYCKILAHFLWQQNAAKAAPKMLFFLFLSTA